MRFLFDHEETVFSLVEETDFFRMKMEKPEIEREHVEEFMDKTVEWLSSNPEKGILIDFTGVTSVCPDFTVTLTQYYEDIKRRGIHVRFVNVAPTVEPYVDVSNITIVMTLPERPSLSAKGLLQDMANELTDRDLMHKYQLSRKGLASMFRKMLLKGLVSRRTLAKRWAIPQEDLTVALELKARKPIIAAAAVLKDMSLNASNVEIMRKYRLTARGLQRLMQKLYKKGLISKAELVRRTGESDHA